MALKGAEGGEGEGEGEERGPGSGSALGAVDIRPILEMNQKYLHSPSVKQRISVFEASIASAVSSSAMDVSQGGAELAAFLFETLPAYQDRASQLCVERVIAKALKAHPSFAKPFASALLQRGLKQPPSSSSSSSPPVPQFMAPFMRHKLLRWSCILLRCCPDIASAKTAFARLAQLQGIQITEILKDPHPRGAEASRHCIAALLRTVPSASAAYLAEVKASPVTFQTVGLVDALLRYFTAKGTKDPLWDDEQKTFFLDLYVKLVLSSREKPPALANEAFAPLMATLSKATFESAVFPSAVKMLRRNPELIMGATGLLFSHIRFDLSPFCLEFLPQIVLQARHQDPAKRAEATDVASALAAQCSDVDAVRAMFESAKAVLAGKEGKLTSPFQRLGMYQLVRALSSFSKPTGAGSSADSGSAPALAKDVSLFLMDCSKGESNEEVSLGILAALSEWMARTGTQLSPDAVVTFFLPLLKHKEAAKRASALRCLRSSFRNLEMRQKVTGLMDDLIAIVKVGVAKPVQRQDALYALLLSVSIAAVDAPSENKMSKEKIWQTVLQGDNPLLSSSILAKLTAEEDVLALVELLEVTLLYHQQQSLDQGKGSSHVVTLAVSLLWSTSSDVRKAAAALVTRCQAISPALSHALFAAFLAWLPAVHQARESLLASRDLDPASGGPPDRASSESSEKPSSASASGAPRAAAGAPRASSGAPKGAAQATGGGGSTMDVAAGAGAQAQGLGVGLGAAGGHLMPACPAREVMARALLLLVPPETVESPRALARLMLACHHPAVAAGRRKSVVWNAAVRSLRRRGVDVAACLGADPNTVCEVLLGEEGLTSEREEESGAALASIQCCMRTIPVQFFSTLLQSLEALGARQAHDALTAHAIKVYQTPQGVLSSEDGVYVATVVKDKNVRQARGRMKLYGDLDDDEDDAKEAAEAKAKAKELAQRRPSQGGGRVAGPGGGKKDLGGPAGKGGKKGDAPKTAKEAAREAQLQEEERVRARVAGVKERTERVLAALGMAASGNPTFCHDQLPDLVGAVLPLLKSPLVASSAFAAVAAITSCVAPSVHHLAADIATALCSVSLSKGTVPEELKAGPETDSDSDSDGEDGGGNAGNGVEGGRGGGEKGDKGGVIERVVTGISAACKHGGLLPAATYGAIFPILEFVLYAPWKTRLHDGALSIIAMHASPFIAIPRVRIIAVLCYVLGHIRMYSDRMAPILRDLFRGLKHHELLPALEGLKAEQSHVRGAVLDAVKFCPFLARQPDTSGASPEASLAATLFMAQFDPDAHNAEAAELVWDMYGQEVGRDYAVSILGALKHPFLDVRTAAASALAAALEEYPDTMQATLPALFHLYSQHLPKPPEKDASSAVPAGFRSREPPPQVIDEWEPRQGVALALRTAADVVGSREVPLLITFLISKALADPNPRVRTTMVEAGAALINQHGKENVALLLPILESYLNKKAVDEHLYDLVREGVIVFLGALARHLSPDDPKVASIMARLLEMLNTPSEAVQRAVSECIPPLLPNIAKQDPEAADKLARQLLHTLLTTDRFAERRGAAFGLGGAVKGLGVRSIQRLGIMTALKAGTENKQSPKAREGALFGFECLSEKLGRLFEPYVIHVLPLLLERYSDSVRDVRDAASQAARTIMSQLSAPGVKLVLPAMLKGLEEKQWRTKQGSVQMLGAMAFCAPRQLSHCLPTVVPKLSEVLTDTHPKVQDAARTALQQIGSVIRNHEIASLVPSLLLGVSDPSKNTRPCLDLLLQTTFVSSVDAASLALLVPIVHRGLRERSAETKKKAAQIVGNMVTLVTDHNDMLPYVPLLLPELNKVLLDQHPDVRGVAARALGSLIKGLGEGPFPDLLSWLMQTLKSEASSVERSGGAQGLSEVMAALGRQRFEALLPEILVNCRSRNPAVRDGHLTLFKFLPSAFGPAFQNHLPAVLPAILDGLADENEVVRDAALAAGHVVVKHYATTSLPLLLPAIEEGLFSDSWRIRHSSVELLGDLLFKVAGTSGKVVLEGGSDDEGASTEAQGRAILDVLGMDKRNEVLASVYMVRSDITLPVRQAGLHVWKTIVANTPKTLKEIMPTLMDLIVRSLASESAERRQMASRAIGELVRKLGERVLPSVIPILSLGLKNPNPSTRQGVCCGLSEVMSAAGKQQLASHMDHLIDTIRQAICDHDADVREAAAQAFGTLYRNAGMQAIDEIIPALLRSLEDEESSEAALDGLKQILSVRTAAVLPHILPKLVRQPLTAFNCNALAALSQVAGPAMAPHLPTVLPPLLSAMGDEGQREVAEAAAAAAEAVAQGVDEEGLEALIGEFTQGLADPNPTTRRGTARIVGAFCRSTRTDLEDEIPSILSTLIGMLTDPDEGTVKAAWDALGNVTAGIPKESLPSYLKVVRDAVQGARDKERRKRKLRPHEADSVTVPGFCLPKGLQPVLQVYLQALMAGSSDMREEAADGLAELVDVASEASLKPFVVPITGPLIRIVGDRFVWQVKSAILNTLSVIIGKGGIALKPFLPQLQTTFLKCLQDNNRTVRSRAAKALGKLTALNPRVDPLVTDLLNSIKAAEPSVKESMLSALRGVVTSGGKALSPAVMERLCDALLALLASQTDEENIRAAAARVLGAASQHMQDDIFGKAEAALTSEPDADAPWVYRLGTARALASIVRQPVSLSRILQDSQLRANLTSSLQREALDDKVPVRECAAKACGRLLAAAAGLEGGSKGAQQVLMPYAALLGRMLEDEATDVRRRVLSGLKQAAKAYSKAKGVPSWLVSAVGKPLAACLQDPSAPIRVTAERTAFHVFSLTDVEKVPAAQKFMTGLEAKRIAKLPELSDASEDSEEELNS